MILDGWLKKHADAKLEVLEPGQRPDAWKKHAVKGTPTLVLEDRSQAVSIVMPGLQSEIKLEQALAQLRGAAGNGQAVDYTKESALTLDLSWEYPGLSGYITIPKDQIKSVRKLQKLDKETRDKLDELRKQIKIELEEANRARKAENEAREKAAAEAAARAEKEAQAAAGATNEGEKLVKEAEELKKALAIYAKFPPPEWGEERLKQIAAKSVARIQPTAEEKEFQENIGLWLKAKQYTELKKGKEEPKGESAEKKP